VPLVLVTMEKSPEASSLVAGLRMAAAYIGALGAVGVVGALGEVPPLGLAVAASLAATGVAYLLQAPAPIETDLTRPADWLRGGMTTLASCLGALAVFAVFPGIADFLCEPLVPWRISIALFGAFAMSWLATGVALRSSFKLAGLMIYLAFFWIAPFYGFFHAPWFLAQTIAVPCAARPFVQAMIAAAGMALAAHAGHRTGDRMFR
jgi:hypothetical protein